MTHRIIVLEPFAAAPLPAPLLQTTPINTFWPKCLSSHWLCVKKQLLPSLIIRTKLLKGEIIKVYFQNFPRVIISDEMTNPTLSLLSLSPCWVSNGFFPPPLWWIRHYVTCTEEGKVAQTGGNERQIDNSITERNNVICERGFKTQPRLLRLQKDNLKNKQKKKVKKRYLSGFI